MSYFRELPNIRYQSFLKDKQSSQDYILVKNIFRRAKIRDDLQNVFTIFNKYEIPDGYRPDNVADEVYGSSSYDWVVIVTSGITNLRDEWPMSHKELYDYSERVYGNDLNAIHHYETKELKDSKGRLLIKKGLKVNENFRINDPDSESGGILNPVLGVTNYEYETEKNNKKRLIYILEPQYLQDVLKDMRQELFYGESSQYIDQKTIQTENTYNTLP
jgi:hypothetical protein|tara:strand:+ start:39 stop:689 length:651 start_codon:yes stop_codon:yes gene_type:complete